MRNNNHSILFVSSQNCVFVTFRLVSLVLPGLSITCTSCATTALLAVFLACSPARTTDRNLFLWRVVAASRCRRLACSCSFIVSCSVSCLCLNCVGLGEGQGQGSCWERFRVRGNLRVMRCPQGNFVVAFYQVFDQGSPLLLHFFNHRFV